MKARSQELQMAEKKKLIKIDPDVHRELNEVGLRGESFSDIILRLIQSYKKHQQKAKDNNKEHKGT